MSQTTPLVNFLGDASQNKAPHNFIIPHYQRGYRWEEQEVTELLNDLWTFCKDLDSGDFYCIQPIVVLKQEENTYEVLDGQQRLTTLYLILSYLEERRIEDGYNQEMFLLNYQTRKDCEEFLRNKKFIDNEDDSNIDYHHICNAYKTIVQWFNSEKHRGAKGKLIPILLDDNSKGNRNVRFIWYEVKQNAKPIDVFIRLNVGKIPLTDAELTKALLLQSDKYDEKEVKFVERKLYEIASEWDTIEYALQSPELWYFLNNQGNGKPTHIEFIFDLIADKLLKEKRYFEKKPIKHATFLILSEYLNDLLDQENLTRIKAVEKIWEHVTGYFEYFREWFNNRTLYHYIGYLIAQKDSRMIDYLIVEAKRLPKKKFIKYLESKIGEIILVDKERKDTDGNKYQVTLEKLNYENEDQRSNDIPEIHKILFLHNVHASLMSDKEKARFPFNLYKKTKKKEKWSLEHIHAQNSQSIVKMENQLTWLDDHIRSLDNQNNPAFEKLIKHMKALKVSDDIKQEKFDIIVNKVYSAIKKEAEIDESNTHSISNLCLVDVNTNSKLNNSVFDVKREKIKEREIQGHYIPVCTRNIFMKAYTKYPVNNAYWTDTDREAYLKSIEDSYHYFVNALKIT
ncbi:MAG: DUF262 domain-containing protein [bacterium]